MKKYTFILLVAFAMTIPANIKAQGFRPPNPPGNGQKTPIDMGVVLLLVAGAGLGIKKLKK